MNKKKSFFSKPILKERLNHKKAEEGYADVSYEDTWNIDDKLATIIAKNLRAFLHCAKKSRFAGFPSELEKKYGQEEGLKQWYNILRKMIYAFEEYTRKPYLDLYVSEDLEEEEIDEDKKQKYMAREEKRQKRIKEGMQLFIDYFNNLWL